MKAVIAFSVVIALMCCSSSIGQADNDLKDFNSDKAKTYSSKKDGKIISDHFTIKYLSDWEPINRQGYIVKRFSKKIGNASVSYSVTVMKIDSPKTEKQIAAELEWMPSNLPKNFNFISNDPNQKTGNLKSALTEYYFDDVVDGRKVRLYFCTYSAFSDNSFIQLQCSVGDDVASNTLESLFKSYKPFFKMVAESFVLIN